MRASRQRRSIRSGGGVVAFLRALAFGSLAFGTFACSSSTPMDMWITKDPDAGRDFDAPMREVSSDTSANGGTGGVGGEGGSGGTGGDTGGAGTTGSGGGGAQAGQGGQSGQGGDTGGASGGGMGGNS